MAFVIQCELRNVEFRGLQSGVGRESGRPWMSLILEREDASQVSVTVPQEMQPELYSMSLRKGDLLNVDVRAVARADGQSYVQLVALPLLVADADGVIA